MLIQQPLLVNSSTIRPTPGRRLKNNFYNVIQFEKERETPNLNFRKIALVTVKRRGVHRRQRNQPVAYCRLKKKIPVKFGKHLNKDALAEDNSKWLKQVKRKYTKLHYLEI